MTYSNDYDPSNENPEDIRARIRLTRMEMSETVDEIQTRLSPENLKHQAQEAVRDATIGRMEDMAETATRKANSWRRSIARTIRDNPIPAALTGVGLAWLFMSGSDEDDYYNRYNGDYMDTTRRQNVRQFPVGHAGDAPRQTGYTRYPNTDFPVGHVRERSEHEEGFVDEVRDQTEAAVERVKEGAHNASEQVGEYAEQVRDQAAEYADQAQQQWQQVKYQTRVQTRRAKNSLTHTFEENPLAVGAAALAIGAIIGAALPHTETEDHWMGDKSDTLKHDAKQAVQQKADQVREVATSTAQEVTSTVKEAAEDVMDTAEGSETTLRPTTGSSRTSGFYSRYQPDFEKHYSNTYSVSGRPYTDYKTAYIYGAQVANDERYKGREWTDVESTLRRGWDDSDQDSAWDDVKDAIQYGWKRVKATLS